jgi:hypothetical protein
MSNYVEEFGLEDYKSMIGDDIDYHDDDDITDCLDDDEVIDRDECTGDMMSDLGMSWSDFM